VVVLGMPREMGSRMRRAAVVLVALLPAVALADAPGLTPDLAPPGLTPEAPPSLPADTGTSNTVTEGYPGQILAADGAAIGMFVAAGRSNDADSAQHWAALGLFTYALGAPIIHLTHHRLGRGAASLGLRVAMPFLGGMLFGGGHGGDETVAIGALIGG